MWRPAFYLLVILFSISVLAIRARAKKFLFIIVPILIQTMIMSVINYAPDFRYMFSTELAALYIIGLLFLPTPELQNFKENLYRADQESYS